MIHNCLHSDNCREDYTQVEQSLSSPSPDRLRVPYGGSSSRALLLSATYSTPRLRERAVGISQRSYDRPHPPRGVADGIPMNELAERILYSKSGFTRVVDRMEEEGLVRRRVRPEHDRRSILVVLTGKGFENMERWRRPPPPPRRNRATLLAAPDGRRRQGADSGAREGRARTHARSVRAASRG